MINNFKKPLFWTNFVVLIFSGWLVAGLVFGWTNPSQNPPGGSGAITVDSLGNVGIGTASPAAKLDVAGTIKTAGLCIGTDCRTIWPPVGFTSFTVVTAIGSNTTSASCPAGHRIIAGACGSNIPVLRTSADAAGSHYLDEANNRTICNQTFNVVYARCVRLQ